MVINTEVILRSQGGIRSDHKEKGQVRIWKQVQVGLSMWLEEEGVSF